MDEDEAALLAELKAISNKSAASRFADDEGGETTNNIVVEDAPLRKTQEEKRSPSNEDRTEVRSFSPPPLEEEYEEEYEQEYPGDYAEDDDEPDLDELLGDDYDDTDLPNNDHLVDQSGDDDVFHDALKSPEKVVPLVEHTSNMYGGRGNFKQETNFQGERGGAAEDAELLALLRGVSAQSKSTDRFADDDHGNDYSEPLSSNIPSSKKSSNDKPWKKDRASAVKSQAVPSSSPRQGMAERGKGTIATDLVVSAPEPEVSAPQDHRRNESPPVDLVMGGGRGNFKQESTFSGERGGAAEDAELLALLRGVSATSSSADRFADSNDDVDASPPPQALPVPKAAATRRESEKKSLVPPWKSAKAKVATTSSTTQADPIVVFPASNAVPALRQDPVLVNGGGNFKQESTFSGERGGAAEDEELLALLRGVSAMSSGANRFADDDTAPTPSTTTTSVPGRAEDQVLVNGGGNFKQESTFSGERGGAAEDEELLALLRGVSAKSSGANRFADEDTAPVPPTSKTTVPGPAASAPKVDPIHVRGNFKQESTFQGERGGAAEDEELLALLRGVSAKSGGADRFGGGDGETPTGPLSRATDRSLSAPAKNDSVPIPVDPAPPSASGSDSDIEVTRDKLPEYITHNNWKVRRDSFILLRTLIMESSRGKHASGIISSGTILPDLDNKIPGLLLDKNATALEEALHLATVYADYCDGGQSAELAGTIATNLIKGGAFTSARPKAIKGSQALAIKLMEVGNDTASINAVVGVLLDQGLPSKMPKIVQMSTSLILEAAQSFGAACLPLAAIKNSLPKMLSHSNKKIRDVGLELVAELCRALGGKSALGAVIEEMKKPQLKELDTLLEKQPQPSEVKIGLRSRQSSGGSAPSAEDAMAALQAGTAQLEAERFAKRPAVNLPEEVQKSEYAEHLKLSKWSEKVAGLDIILKCAGEKPYKLVQPSSAANYAALIAEIKSFLPHTHFAVVTKALDVLAMMAEGVGEKLYPNLRPLLPKLFSLSKDKKLTRPVASCLDAFFGNVLSFDHILDADSAIPQATSEKTERNALVRSTTLDFLVRCVARGSKAGPRGALTASTAKLAAQVAAEKLGDSDASVRTAALEVLKEILKIEDLALKRTVQPVIDGLEASNPRAFKQLGKVSVPPATVGIPRPAPSGSPTSTLASSATTVAPLAKHSTKTSVEATTVAGPEKTVLKALPAPLSSVPSDVPDNTSIDEATDYVASLGIPQWDAEADDGGILAGMLSTKWLLRQNAIKGIASFIIDREFQGTPGVLQKDTSCIMVFVKEHTRGFNETNVQVAKCILELFLAICDSHENKRCPLPTWAACDMANMSCSKIADKKLSPISKSLLMSVCVVTTPRVILGQAYESISHVKSPLAQEEFLRWLKSFAETFGAASLGGGLRDAVEFLSKQCESPNLKVKKSAYAVMGVFHIHLGAPFEGLVLASTKDPSLREHLKGVFSEHPHDPTALGSQWAKQSLVTENRGNTDQSSSGGTLDIELATFDLISELPADIIARMGSNDSKTSWKARKAAMEDLEEVMKRCTGLLDTSKLKPLVDLLRTVRDRLSDSQSNLKPIAARLIGVIMSATDAMSQAKLGKVVYGPLINSAMNDSRAIMHNACMEALRIGTSLPKLQGAGPNDQALEPFLVALVGELDESDFKNTGIADVLDLTKSFAGLMSDLDGIASQGGNTLGSRLAKVLVNGLSSSKVDIRSSSETLMEACVRNGSISIATVKKVVGRQKPAVQRTLAPVIQKLSSTTATTTPSSNIPLVDSTEPNVAVHDLNSERALPKTTIRARSSQPPPITHSASRQVAEVTTKATPSSPHRTTADANPLVGNSGAAGLQKSKAALRSMTWPEYPEEPSGDLILGALKKAWSPLIPLESTKHLFPGGDIKKQDDAMAGCELLSRAIAMDRAEEGFIIGEQFSLIWKWMTFVLCCKESTVGTQSLLQLTSDLIDHLRYMKYEISDAEAMVFVPHLFDKASAAKGRFKETYMDLIEQLKAEDLLPTKRLGPLVCVGIIEGSSYPKARLLACKECQLCVEKIGLSGVGKRGVLAVAKSLSEENLQENRNALVELMALLVLRMNGDMQRFTRICGPALNGKARSLIEERLKKGGFPASVALKPRTSVLSPSPQTSSIAFKGSKATPSKPINRTTLTPKSSPDMQPDYDVDDEIKDELPALDLRLGMRPTPISSVGIARPQTSRPSLTSGLQLDPLDVQKVDQRQSDDVGNTIPSPTEEDRESLRSILFTSSSHDSESSLGAAASLRARLMKIRERNKTGPVPTSGENSPHRGRSDEPQTSVVEFPAAHQDQDYRSSSLTDLHVEETSDRPSPDLLPGVSHLGKFLDAIRRLLSRDLPLSEEDSEIIECTDVLKSIHAAVSQQPGLAVNLDVDDVSRLRQEIKANSNEVVETLTRLIAFGFDCHGPDCNGGMSVPLLSVNLASLMAIFRSEDVAKSIRVEDLTVLIKEAGKALLDPRLASSSPTNSLDEGTSTQMVRAINKLAVQAATGSTRHFALEALMTMQQQLCLKADPTDDPLFNSRLSRVVSKLFARVVKAEEAAPSPFAPPGVDLESIICVMEDTLSACEKAQGTFATEAIAATKNLAIVLITAILKARGEAEKFRAQMEGLEIGSGSSLGRLVGQVAEQMGITAPHTFSISRQQSSVEVAALVSAVGEASVGAERDAAVSALKAYKAEYGDEDLNNHLTQVSAAFRTFILEHLSDNSNSCDAEKPTPSSMSERIKSLRSKLNATELVVQSAVDQTRSASSETDAAPTASSGDDATTETNHSTASSDGVRAFRQRLAAARSASDTAEQSENSESTATAGSRAAALRARLQAVKRQTEI